MAPVIVNRTVYTNPGGAGHATFALSAPATSGNTLIIVAMSLFNHASWLTPTFISTDTDGIVTQVPFYTLNPLPSNAWDFGSWWEASGGASLVSADVLYVKTIGANNISFNCSGSPFIWVYEVSGLGTPTVDSFGLTGANATNKAVVIGPALTGTDNPDFIVVITPTANDSYASVPGPWTLDPTIIFGNAPAHLIASGTQVGLDYGIAPDDFTSVAVAFKPNAPPPPSPGLFKLLPGQTFDEYATDRAINSTYCTYGFVNSAKAAQNPLLGFHRKRYSEIQMYIKGTGQETTTLFPNYIVKSDLTLNPAAYSIPPIVLQTDPSDDIVRPVNSVGNRVYVMYSTDAVGAAFNLSKTILVGIVDSYNVVNPNAG